jgi:hypothetical protein
LFLRDLGGHAQIIEERRMDMPELVPRHAPQPCRCCYGLKHALEHLGFAEWLAVRISEQQIVGCGY